LRRNIAAQGLTRLRAAANPFLAALVELLLPKRDSLLELVDDVLAGSEGVLAVRCGDGDDTLVSPIPTRSEIRSPAEP
jgi:hypothetical protein